MTVKVKVKRTFVFNEKGNTNPDGFIFVNDTDLFKAYKKAEHYASNDIMLVDCYTLSRKSQKRYNSVPAWAV